MALRDKGHNITFVTSVEDSSTQNFTVILLEGLVETMHRVHKFNKYRSSDALETTIYFYEYFSSICEYSYETNGIKQLINLAKARAKFDLILVDIVSGQCYFPIFEQLCSPPVVGTSSFGIHYYNSFDFGFSYDASFVPLYMLPYSEQMTFTQRLNNYFYTMVSVFYHYNFFIPNMWSIAEKVFGPQIPNYRTILNNFSFLLANYDPLLDIPRSLPPTVIPVGGLHVYRSGSLTKDLQDILDNAKGEVIVFSLGTNVRSDLFSKNTINALTETFAQLEQTVVWKFESNITNLSENVVVRPWLPQNDLLKHPNVKLLITHGGALSTQEALIHGVPIIGIPFFVDQYFNMYKITSRALGVTLHRQSITKEHVLETIYEILNNPVYKSNMLKISKRYQAKPENALERAVFWAEYALRHGGQHLQVPSLYMPSYQLYYFDIWAFVILLLFAAYAGIKMLRRQVFQKSSNTKLKLN